MLKKIISRLMLTVILVGILTVSSQRSETDTLKQHVAHKDLEDQAIIVSHTPTTRDFKKMKDRIGVWREDAKYGQTAGSHGTGLLPPTEQEWTRIKNNIYVVDEIRLDQTTTIPSKVDHSVGSWFPPVGNQGEENSCVAWAVGYYTKTFQEAREHGWDLSGAEWEEMGYPTPEFQDKIFSPDFIYHLINKGVDKGSTFSKAIDLVAFLGACSWKNMPYDPHNYTGWPSEEAWREATFYRANSSGIEYMELETDEDIVSLRNWIASDHLALISVDSFQYSELTDKDFWTLDNYDSRSTSHANSIVGFDDDIRYFEQGEWRYGAFKIVNSWGKGGWENILDGYYWISYETMKQRIGYCMFYCDRIDYSPELVSSFQLEHSKSDDGEISIGIGNYTNPLATKSFSHLVETGDHSFCSNRIVFDVTELKDGIPTVVNQSFFISFYDKGMSTVHSWTSGWRTNGSSYSWFRLGQTLDVPENGATLKFWSYYEIEEDWDYGYVEVHDLKQDEWYTLPGFKTKSTLPEPQDNPNCPSEFEPSTYYDSERWHAFTGLSKAMYQEEMDLSPFANHTIEIYFTYWTDPLVLERGWYIDDIEIVEIGLFDDVENGQGNWTNNGWNIAIPEPPSTGTISSFSIENYHIHSSTLIAMSSSTTVPVNTEDQNYVFVELILHASNTYINVNVSEAKQMIESNPSLAILDVRTQEEYDEGHIENAVLIPVNELESRLNELDPEKEVLVYCRSGVRSATASQILVDNGFVSVYNMLCGITAWRNEGYWIEIIYEGDLVIDGTETFAIENCTFIVKGSIHVEDFARLVTKKALLVVDQNYTSQHKIQVVDSGELRIEDTTLNSPFGFDVYVYHEARVDFINSTSVCPFYCSGDSTVYVHNSTLHLIENMDRSRVVISDSRITYEIILVFCLSSQQAHLEGLEPGIYSFWNLHQNQSVLNVEHDLTIENTFVNSWCVRMRDSMVTISNSEISTMVCEFDNTNAIINGARLGYYGNWTISKLNLLNTSITTQFRLWFRNSIAEISNSTVQLDLYEYSNVLIRDSTLNWLKILYLMNGISHFSEAEIDMIMPIFSSFYFSGEINFPSDAHIYAWIHSNITRNYNVIVGNMSNGFLKDVELTLIDQNGTVVWTGLTNSQGEANFNLTFTDSNYTYILRLKVVKGNYSATTNVSFLSDTPVVLTMRYFADLNGDGTVNIVDISIVAIAFRTKAGDENWDPIADLDKNDEINIIDVSIVALDYGKTV